MNDATKETFICIQKASAGARKTSETGVFSFICKNGFVKSNFISDFSGKRKNVKQLFGIVKNKEKGYKQNRYRY